MRDEESPVMFKGVAGISLILTSILFTYFWVGLVKVSQSESVVVAPERSVTQSLTIDELLRLRRQARSENNGSKDADPTVELHRLVEQKVQAHEREMELQRQQEKIDLLIAARKAEIEQSRQEVLLAEAQHLRKKQEAIATALSQLSSLRQTEGASPTGMQRTSASF